MSESEKAELNRLRRRCQQLESLVSVGAMLTSTLDLDELLKLILSSSEKVMDAETSTFFMLDEIKQELYVEIAMGDTGNQLKNNLRLKVGHGIAGWVAQTGKARLVTDAYADPQFNPEYDRKTGFRTRSILCAPLKVKDRLLGVGQVINKRGADSFTEADLEFFTLFCNVAAVAIENAQLHRLMLEKQGMDRELELARTIQQHFLPQHFPHHPKLAVAAQNIPANNVGGDFYDVIPLSRERVGIVIGDVSGKGVHAALYASRLLSDFKHLAHQELEPHATLRLINQQMVMLNTMGMFATVLYMILDPRSETLVYANAGHIPPLLIDCTKDTVNFLDGDSGPPLGMIKDLHFPLLQTKLRGDGFICLVTDGITEARDGTGEQLGLERTRTFLKEILERKDLGPDEVITYCAETFQSRGRIQSDDITLVVAQIRDWGVESKNRPEVSEITFKSKPEELTFVRRWMEEVCQKAAFPMPQTQLVLLAVDEACTNVIRYAYNMDFSKEMILRAILYSDRLELRLRDYGQKADPSTFCRIKKDPLEPGGLGCKAMSEIMDDIRYNVDLPLGTELTMVKKRSFA